jgi:hypothetical protein
MSFSLWCLIFGHDDMMVRAPERLRLRCDHCGRETPGWSLGRGSSACVAHTKSAPTVATHPGLAVSEAEHRVAA